MVVGANGANLNKPARYFPLEKGLYEVAPGMRKLGDLGNGPADSLIFQIDADFDLYRANRLNCRLEQLEKYYIEHNYPSTVSSAVNRYIAAQLAREHPAHFQFRANEHEAVLECLLTGETLTFDRDFALKKATPVLSPEYRSGFDALASQVQEDIAIVCLDKPATLDWLACIHLCSPSHWAAEDKIGKSFVAIHKPIPGVEKVNAAAASLLDAVLSRGPYVRFVWGVGFDRQLNHHPSFKSANAPEIANLTLRVERQVLVGLPEVAAVLFAIHVSFIDGTEILKSPHTAGLLRSALLSMSPESRVYKGLHGRMDEVIAWLDSAVVT